MPFNNSKIFKIDNSGKSPAIFFKKKIIIDNKIIKKLITYSRFNSYTNCRICLHKSKTSKLHNMIVLLNKNNIETFKFHKHKNSCEYYQIMYGSLNLHIKNKSNTNKINLSLKKNKLFYYVDLNIYHKIVPETNIVIFNEIKINPYI